MGAKSENKGVELAKMFVAHPLSECQWNRSHFSMKKRESEKHKKKECASRSASKATLPLMALFWAPLASGEHVVGRSVVQLDYDEELGLVRGVYGSMYGEFKVQRTKK